MVATKLSAADTQITVVSLVVIVADATAACACHTALLAVSYVPVEVTRVELQRDGLVVELQVADAAWNGDYGRLWY